VLQRIGVLPVVGYSVANIKVTDIKDSKPGFALGAEYKLDENWQFGLRYRSPIRIEGSSTIGGDVHTASGATVGLKSADATVVTEFPQALTLGALHKCDDMWTILAEYGWTNYSKIDVIDINGPIVTSTGTTLASKAAVPMYWQDQHNYRLAAQYGHEGEWPLRFGYGYTSQVTNTDYARAAFTAPAAAHTLAVGTGRDFTWSERAMRFDSGLEYTWSSGSGNPNGAAAGSASGDFRQGDFALSSYALHLGLASTF
jgi:long-subunit fatty acid transport protein